MLVTKDSFIFWNADAFPNVCFVTFRTRTWHLVRRTWHVAKARGGTWRVTLGTWHMALGIWHWALGTWHLALRSGNYNWPWAIGIR